MSNVLLPHHPFLIYRISIKFIYKMDGEEFILYLLIKHTKHFLCNVSYHKENNSRFVKNRLKQLSPLPIPINRVLRE